MGDVAMSVPVVYSFCRSYPDTHFTFLTKRSLGDMFVCPPKNLTVVSEDLSQYRGLMGMLRLYRKIDRSRRIDAVADLHDVIRSKLLRFAARIYGAKVAYIDKGRREKRLLTRRKGKVMRQLPSSHQRYVGVFNRLGLFSSSVFSSLFEGGRGDGKIFSSLTAPKAPGEVWVGIAPFAAHRGKIYPLEKMEEIVKRLYDKGIRLFFFGGGESERQKLHEWTEKYPGSVSLAEKRHGFALELSLQSYLDVMVSMDSGNMHLASLAGVPTVTIWGATHPYCGFAALNQAPSLIVQAEGMDCRPCSVFGNRPCIYGDYRCMNSVSPETVLDRIGRVIPTLVNNCEKEERH